MICDVILSVVRRDIFVEPEPVTKSSFVRSDIFLRFRFRRS
jgi:hypothetical protein